MHTTLRLIDDFILLLRELVELKNPYFSGAGFVLYKNLETLSTYHCNLINDKKNLPLLKLGSQSLTNYLSKISSYKHPYHDGFHFINHKGQLTHVAQFFSPPVNDAVIRIPGQGARTFCAQCGSIIDGVLMIGSVSSNGQIYLFERGNLINVNY